MFWQLVVGGPRLPQLRSMKYIVQKVKRTQIKEGDYYFIKSNLFDEDQVKEIYRFGITSKNIDEFEVGETALFKR